MEKSSLSSMFRAAGSMSCFEGYEFRELSLSGAQIGNPVDTRLMTHPLFDPVSRQWVGFQDRSATGNVEMVSPALEVKWRGAKKAFPGYNAHLISWSARLDRMIVYTDGGDDSGTYWMVDIAARSADPLGRAHPLVKAGDVASVSEVDWRAADGLQLSGILTLPSGKATKPLPLVVLVHGGPELRSYEGFDWWTQAFAVHGYAVLQPNYRGSSDLGYEFRNAGLGEWGRKMQDLGHIGWRCRSCEQRSYRSETRVYYRQGLWRLRGAGRRDSSAGSLSLRDCRCWCCRPRGNVGQNSQQPAGYLFFSALLENILGCGLDLCQQQSRRDLARCTGCPRGCSDPADSRQGRHRRADLPERNHGKRAETGGEACGLRGHGERRSLAVAGRDTDGNAAKSAVDFVEKYNPAK